MASVCLSSVPLSSTSTSSTRMVASASTSSSSSNLQHPTRTGCILNLTPSIVPRKPLISRRKMQVVCMAPQEERLTRRSPLEFPSEWERPTPGWRPDIFPQFSPMKIPLPTPIPADKPLEEEDWDEEEYEEEEGDGEEPENPEE